MKATLEELVAKCRKIGIIHFSGLVWDGSENSLAERVEFTLGPAPVETQPEVVDKVEESANVKPKLGKDGLTAAQQEELYGVVHDAEG